MAHSGLPNANTAQIEIQLRSKCLHLFFHFVLLCIKLFDSNLYAPDDLFAVHRQQALCTVNLEVARTPPQVTACGCTMCSPKGTLTAAKMLRSPAKCILTINSLQIILNPTKSYCLSAEGRAPVGEPCRRNHLKTIAMVCSFSKPHWVAGLTCLTEHALAGSRLIELDLNR